MKHAYLIIAHNEFEVLQLLVSALDDERNDIYVHIDKKVRTLPKLHTSKSKLCILDRRIDVRWGHYSQIETEILLFETALHNGPYEHYHLISGTHLPLKNKDQIHSFFNDLQGKNIFSNLKTTDRHYQEILKVHRINFFLRGYSSPIKLKAKTSQLLWKAFIAVQRWLNITINDDTTYYWANNWCSLTNDAAAYLISKKDDIRCRYRWSFCGDEFVVPTELMRSSFADTLVSSYELLYGAIGRSNASVLTIANYESMVESGCIFGRKFSKSEQELLIKVKELFR